MNPYYQDDSCTIFHGDCRDVLPELQPVDLVLTDPPYKHSHMDGGGFAAATKFYREGALDGMNSFDMSSYEALLINAGKMLISFHSRDLIGDYAKLAETFHRKYDLHFWHKTNAIPFTKNTWKSDVEYIALIWDKKPGWKQLEQHRHSKVYTSPINQDNKHPAAKPLKILQKYIQILDAQTILDPFAGSFTTAAAAKLLGRKCIAIEKEEKYCEIGVERLRQECFDFG